MKESHSPSASFCGVKRTPLHEEIAQCAQEIWLQSGKPADRDMAIWLEAEQRLHSAIPVPQRILPHKPEDYFRHAHNSVDFAKGKEKPAPNSFFAPIAEILQPGGQILVFGTGTGTSSEMDQFIAWLKLHHPETAGRIVGTLVVDEGHLSEGQLLAKAREFYESRSRSQP
jgi:hypothetical protein